MSAGRTRCLGIVVLAMLVAGGFWIRLSAAAPTAANPRQPCAVDSALTKGESLYKRGKFAPAAVALGQAEKSLSGLAGTTDLARQLRPLARRIANLHDNLGFEGVNVPAIDAAAALLADSSSTKSAARGTPARPSTKRPLRTVAGAVSFTKQIAPFLVEKCGKCHVTAAKGTLSMATYAAR